MKAKKAKKQLDSRIKDYERTCAGPSNGAGFHKPGSMAGRK